MSVSIVIPTFGRDAVMVETVRAILALAEPPSELLVIDQTPAHDPETEAALSRLVDEHRIRWIRLEHPSVTQAMNVGLCEARGDVVLFLDDDIIPYENLVTGHRTIYEDLSREECDKVLVAGRVLQPWHIDGTRPIDRLASTEPGLVDEFIGCNFSVKREAALALGGFDERFVRVAYRYEAEFAHRARVAGCQIWFAPDAAIHHLRAERGGTRSFGDHLRTATPAHAVGLYYYLLRARPPGWWHQIIRAPFRAILTRFHQRHPWWIPPVLLAQFAGLAWALLLLVRGPALVSPRSSVRS